MRSQWFRSVKILFPSSIESLGPCLLTVHFRLRKEIGMLSFLQGTRSLPVHVVFHININKSINLCYQFRGAPIITMNYTGRAVLALRCRALSNAHCTAMTVLKCAMYCTWHDLLVIMSVLHLLPAPSPPAPRSFGGTVNPDFVL